MKKISLITLMMLMCLSHYSFAESIVEICCPDGYTEQQCCEEINDGVWCSDKGVCAEYSALCNAVCTGRIRPSMCACITFTVSVAVGLATETYCCSSSDDSKRSCCQALGFTWVGPDKNSGTCYGPEPDVCVYMIDAGSGMPIFH